MWSFCFHSLFREYGAEFLKRVVLRHPVRVARAIFETAGFDDDRRSVFTVPPGIEEREVFYIGTGSVVGLGFCLKPMDPPCISGRPNHDCYFLEHQYMQGEADLHECCRGCVIREIGQQALNAGVALYIMTSARDILVDVFLPSLDEQSFSTGLFALCRYSIHPFSIPLMVTGVEALLFPYEWGDCMDYGTWLLADRGVKNEQTNLQKENLQVIRDLLENAAGVSHPSLGSVKRGNIYYPNYEDIST